MKALSIAAVVVVFVGIVCCGPLQRTSAPPATVHAVELTMHTTRKRWSVHTPVIEAAPGMAGEQLVDVLAQTPDIRHSDLDMRLTAVKNSKFKACFIVDLDPNFNLDEEEMRRVISEMVSETVKSPQDVYQFRKKAGPDIATMCQYMSVYWLNAVAPPLPAMNVPDMVKVPEPIRTDVLEAARPVTGIIAPPPVNVYRAMHDSSGPKAPPPLSQYLHQRANQNVQQAERVTMAPPLALWRQQQANQNMQKTERATMAPTPLAL